MPNLFLLLFLCLIGRHGDYYRLLIDGYYQIRVIASGFQSQVRCHKVHNKMFHEADRLDFVMISQNHRNKRDVKERLYCKMLQAVADNQGQKVNTTLHYIGTLQC